MQDRIVHFYAGAKIIAEGNNLDIYRPHDFLIYHTSKRNIEETSTEYDLEVFAERVFLHMRHRNTWNEDDWESEYDQMWKEGECT